MNSQARYIRRRAKRADFFFQGHQERMLLMRASTGRFGFWKGYGYCSVQARLTTSRTKGKENIGKKNYRK